MKKVTAHDLLQTGGKWLGAVREWIQWNIPRGDQLTWGSDEQVTLTVKQLEELGAEVAKTILNDKR